MTALMGEGYSVYSGSGSAAWTSVVVMEMKQKVWPNPPQGQDWLTHGLGDMEPSSVSPHRPHRKGAPTRKV